MFNSSAACMQTSCPRSVFRGSVLVMPACVQRLLFRFSATDRRVPNRQHKEIASAKNQSPQKQALALAALRTLKDNVCSLLCREVASRRAGSSPGKLREPEANMSQDGAAPSRCPQSADLAYSSGVTQAMLIAQRLEAILMRASTSTPCVSGRLTDLSALPPPPPEATSTHGALGREKREGMEKHDGHVLVASLQRSPHDAERVERERESLHGIETETETEAGAGMERGLRMARAKAQLKATGLTATNNQGIWTVIKKVLTDCCAVQT
jgi:hypothetical protein